MSINETHLTSAEDIAERASELRKLGISWVRVDFDWSTIRPEREGAYQLERMDLIVQSFREQGINLLGLLAYTPAWANGNKDSKFHPPVDPADFARFASDMATRYAPMGVHAWEIWNEPNLGQFWQPAASPVGYVELLKLAYPAIRDADPNAIVVTGGLAQPRDSEVNISALRFLKGVYAAGGSLYFDAVGNHAYIPPELPSESTGNNWHRMFSTVPSLRSIMTSYSDATKKIWITEFGAPTGGSGITVVSERAQSAMLEEAFRLIQGYEWAGPLFWYNYKDFCAYGTPDVECYYGIVRSDGTPKPAYHSMAEAPG